MKTEKPKVIITKSTLKPSKAKKKLKPLNHALYPQHLPLHSHPLVTIIRGRLYIDIEDHQILCLDGEIRNKQETPRRLDPRFVNLPKTRQSTPPPASTRSLDTPEKRAREITRRERISAKLKNRIKPDSTRAKMSEAKKGKEYTSDQITQMNRKKRFSAKNLQELKELSRFVFENERIAIQ